MNHRSSQLYWSNMVNESQEEALRCISNWIDIAEIRNGSGHTRGVYESTRCQHEQQHRKDMILFNFHKVVGHSAEEETLTDHCYVYENSIQKKQSNI